MLNTFEKMADGLWDESSPGPPLTRRRVHICRVTGKATRIKRYADTQPPPVLWVWFRQKMTLIDQCQHGLVIAQHITV
jgi:hypothetical protein